jgi:hypothetical protein
MCLVLSPSILLSLNAEYLGFENYWVDLPGFMDCVAASWSKSSHKTYSSAILADKLKGLRYDLKNGTLVYPI